MAKPSYYKEQPELVDMPIGKFNVIGDASGSVRVFERTTDGAKLVFEGDPDAIEQLALALRSVAVCVRKM